MLALSKKLCPLFSFFCLMACGKKITEPQETVKPLVQHQVPSPTLIIAIEERQKIFEPENIGGLKLPDQLRVRSGNALGKMVVISYNVLPEDYDYFEFKCTYTGVSNTSMPLQKCVDMEGNDLGNVTNIEFPIDSDKLIRFDSDSDDLKADAIYEVRWLF